MGLKKDFRRLIRFAGRVWLGGGIACLLLSVGFSIYTRIFISNAERSSGTILRLVPIADKEDGAVNYAPVFTFAADDGKIYTITSDTSTNPPEFEVGQSVPVLYSKGNPAGAKLSSFGQLWIDTVVSASLGAVFTTLGGFFVWTELRSKRFTSAVPAEV